MTDFYDERINSECGRIYRRGMIYATLVTLIYGILRAVVLYSNRHLEFSYFYTELAIVVCGVIILAAGTLKFFGESDERVEALKHSYYLRAAKIFLVVALAGYAVSIPFSLHHSFVDVPTNQLILILEVLGTVYLFYAFKSKNINFNYSFIHEERGEYYLRVFKNIGKLSATLFVAFFFSAMLDLGINRSFVSFFGILEGYLDSCVGLGLEYLLISWIEKASYDEDESEKLKKGTRIAFFFCLGVQIIASVVNIIYVKFATGNLSDYGGKAGEILASFSYKKLHLSYLLTALLAVFFCHLLTQTVNERLCRAAIRGRLWIMGISTASGTFLRLAVMLLSEDMKRIYAEYSNIFSELLTVINIVLIGLLAAGLVKRYRASRVVWLCPAAQTAGFLVGTFMTNQNMLFAAWTIRELLTVFAMIIGFCVLKKCEFLQSKESVNERVF